MIRSIIRVGICPGRDVSIEPDHRNPNRFYESVINFNRFFCFSKNDCIYPYISCLICDRSIVVIGFYEKNLLTFTRIVLYFTKTALSGNFYTANNPLLYGS